MMYCITALTDNSKYYIQPSKYYISACSYNKEASRLQTVCLNVIQDEKLFKLKIVLSTCAISARKTNFSMVSGCSLL